MEPMNTETLPLIVVLGPTASGKTAAGIEIAKQVGGEIICADSRTIYRGMDIGTAKPTNEEQDGIVHHLLDIITPDKKYSAAQFKDDTAELIKQIWARGNWPIIVGGTGLYIDSILFDYQFAHKSSERSSKNPRHLSAADQSDRHKPLRLNTIVLGLNPAKEILQRRIEHRVRRMFEEGFLEEVKQLADQYGWGYESMSGIGYRVARAYFEGRASIDEVTEAFVRRDISLAKRQRTWFKRNNSIQWCADQATLINKAVQFAEEFKV
jgi:tRNA dimethylallyltransferase